MDPCNRLFRAENLYAFYASAQKHVVIVADVWLNPYSDKVHLCPSLLARPSEHEYLLEGWTRPGIHPMLIAKERVTTSFPSDLTPKSIVVYTQGIDAPARHELPVTGEPPPAFVQATPPPNAPAPNAHAPAPDAPDAPDAHKPAGAGESVEVIGYSLAYSFEEAMHDAINQARARFPAPPRNPDVGVRVEVIQIYSSAGGNIRPGLFIKAKAQ